MPDGTLKQLTKEFYHDAVRECMRKGYEALVYNLTMPDVDEPMMLIIHRNGDVDSSTVDRVLEKLAAK